MNGWASYARALAWLTLALVLITTLMARGVAALPTRPVELRAVALPERIGAEERTRVFGGLAFPEGHFALDVELCDAARSRCELLRRRPLEGPVDLWALLTILELEQGAYVFRIRAYERSGPLGRLVGGWERAFVAE